MSPTQKREIGTSYIIFHFHVMQGENAFRAVGNGVFNQGVVSMSVHYGQTMDPNPSSGSETRVRYRHGTPSRTTSWGRWTTTTIVSSPSAARTGGTPPSR